MWLLKDKKDICWQRAADIMQQTVISVTQLSHCLQEKVGQSCIFTAVRELTLFCKQGSSAIL